MCGIKHTTVLLLIVVVMCSSVMEEFVPEEDDIFRNIIRTPEHILVGSSSFLYRLNTTLSVEERLALTAENRLLVVDNRTYNGNFLSCDNTRCFLAEIRNFANMSWQVLSDSTLVREGTMNLYGLFVPSSSGTSELIFAETANGQAARRVVRGGLSDVVFSSTLSPPVNSTFDLLASRTENRVLDPITYYTQFTHDRFIYFVHDPEREESSIRVQRFCIEDSGEDNLVFASHIEIRLACGDSEGLLTAAHFVASPLLSDPTLIVSKSVNVGSDRVRVDVCTFSVPEIDRLMREKFRECVEGQGDAGFSRQGGQSGCTRGRFDNLENDLTMICRFPGPARQGLEVTDPFERPVLFSHDFPMAEHFTSLTTTQVEDSLFLFAGSSNSKIYQYHLTDSSATFIRAIYLSGPQANITALLSSAGGEQIYTMSPNKLVRHQVDQCHTLTNCFACVDSGDPICGWCALSGSCVRRGDCEEVQDRLGNQQRIFVQMSSACPAIERSQPTIIYLQQLQFGAMASITLTTNNIQGTDAANFTFNCVFRFSSHPAIISMAMSFSNDSQTIKCLSPPALEISALLRPEVDTVSAEVSLQVMETQVDIATLGTRLAFADCHVHTSCMRCISSGVNKCKWCLDSFQCNPNLDEFSCSSTFSSSSNATVTSTENTCQLILPPSDPAISNYKVHSGFIYPSSPLLIHSQNLNSLSPAAALSCRICETDFCTRVLSNVSATYLSDSNLVRCNLNSITTALSTDTPSKDLVLQVLIENYVIDNPNNTGVTIFNCEYMGSNCAQCLSLADHFGCSYCGPQLNVEGNCVFADTNLCNGLQLFEDIRNCDPPVIANFFPREGPIQGGTEISVVGRNLGIVASDIENIRIGGYVCAMTDYRIGVGFNCTTGEVGSNIIDMPIMVELAFQDEPIESEDTFRYLVPLISNPPVMPRVGPRSGGTLVTVSGQDLGSGSTRNVSIRGQECVVKGFDQNNIFCLTPPNQPSTNNLLEVHVDFWSSQATGFDYVEDPIFEGISPNISFVAGGTTYTVTGQRFDIIQAPRLLIYLTTSGQDDSQIDTEAYQLRSEPCEVTNSISMLCLAPTLNIERQMSFPLTAQIGLLADGVSSLLTINTTMLTIHPNPQVDVFSDMSLSPASAFFLTITGSGFFFLPEQVEVSIVPCMATLCTCSVLQVYSSNNSLVCEVKDPEDLPVDQELFVTVTVGNFSARAGSIYISTPLNLLAVLIPTFSSFLVLSCVAIFILLTILIWSSRFKQKRHTEVIESQPVECRKDVLMMEEFVSQLPPSLIIPSSQIRILDITLGQGQSGMVYKAHLIHPTGSMKTSMRSVAIKIMKEMFSYSDVQSISSEISQMKELSHPNVMSLLGVCVNAAQGPAIVMPYMANGSLLDYLKKERKSLYLDFNSETETTTPAGMHFGNEDARNNITIFARVDSNGNIKVSDFGLSEDVYTTGYFREDKDSHVKLPFKWMAPESLTDRVFNEKTDVWSFGVTCWEVFSGGRTPYPAVNPTELPRLLEEGMRLEYPSNAANAPEIYSIICKCWKFSSDDRPNFDSLSPSFEEKLQSATGYLELKMALEIQAESQGYETIEDEMDANAAHVFPKPGFINMPSTECEIVKNAAYSISVSEEPEKHPVTVAEKMKDARKKPASSDNEEILVSAFEMVANTAYSTSTSSGIVAKDMNGTEHCKELRLATEFKMVANTAYSSASGATSIENTCTTAQL